MVSVLAILCVRNEERHVAACLEDLIDHGVEVHLIDHSSSDTTLEIARSYLGRGVCAIESMAWEGSFSLSEQLRAKARAAARARHDWLIHIDADESLTPLSADMTLQQAISAVDEHGYNAVNFEEFVFVPEPGERFDPPDYRRQMTQYYFFEPSKYRLMRAFKRTDDLGAWTEAGHRLAKENLRLSPVDFILRHYVALSGADFERKYRNRAFSPEDLSKGWHQNRIDMERFELPDPADHHYLKNLEFAASCDFDRSDPAPRHFWQWDDDPQVQDRQP